MIDLLSDRQRTLALTVVCEYCHAAIGDRCVNPKTGELIEHQAAHFVRITAAGKASAR